MKEEIERGITFGGIVGLFGVLHHGCSTNSSGGELDCGKEAEKIQQIRVFRYLYINGTLFGIIKKMDLVWIL
jgi:hypothetical protein